MAGGVEVLLDELRALVVGAMVAVVVVASEDVAEQTATTRTILELVENSVGAEKMV